MAYTWFMWDYKTLDMTQEAKKVKVQKFQNLTLVIDHQGHDQSPKLVIDHRRKVTKMRKPEAHALSRGRSPKVVINHQRENPPRDSC